MPSPPKPPPLPRRRMSGPVNVQAKAAQEKAVQPKAPTPVSLAETKGARSVLVIEDDAATRRLILRALRGVYTVYEAEDGQQAADILESITPEAAERAPVDCVISDIMMPRLSGTDLAKKMRQDKRFKTVPIIFVTAKGLPGDRAEGIGAGARFYITKPFSLKGLLEKVAEAMSKKE